MEMGLKSETPNAILIFLEPLFELMKGQCYCTIPQM